jgi:hypothetical protein
MTSSLLSESLVCCCWKKHILAHRSRVMIVLQWAGLVDQTDALVMEQESCLLHVGMRYCGFHAAVHVSCMYLGTVGIPYLHGVRKSCSQLTVGHVSG